jgi:hypothetical protein
MRTAGIFVLNVEPETAAMPKRVSIALTGVVPDHHGVLRVTPNCMSLDELDGYMNALQDELDVIRGEARLIFVASVGRAFVGESASRQCSAIDRLAALEAP